jgi:hypothetical protein
VTLLPQPGITIVMARVAAQRFGEPASVILTVVVSFTFLLEIFGPVLTHKAIRIAAAS